MKTYEEFNFQREREGVSWTEGGNKASFLLVRRPGFSNIFTLSDLPLLRLLSDQVGIESELVGKRIARRNMSSNMQADDWCRVLPFLVGFSDER